MYEAKQENGAIWGDRFALHFFLFYDLGEAAKAAASEREFWEYTKMGYDTFKRGRERRHFRSDAGWEAVKKLSKMGDPSEIWWKMAAPTYTNFIFNIQTNFQGCQIGPYFAWKAMDILDRCIGHPMKLSHDEARKYLPDQPRKCAAIVFPDATIGQTLDLVTKAIADLPAPGAPGRNCGYSEAETILCAIYGQFVNNSYKFGDDLRRRHKELAEFPELKKFLPEEIK